MSVGRSPDKICYQELKSGVGAKPQGTDRDRSERRERAESRPTRLAREGPESTPGVIRLRAQNSLHRPKQERQSISSGLARGLINAQP